MFTMRIVYPNKEEKGMEISEWFYVPFKKGRRTSEKGENDVPAHLTVYSKGSSISNEIINDGDVYIMNESGKTVADYHFDVVVSDVN